MMFENTFKESVSNFTSNPEIVAEFWDEIKFYYSKPGKYYHTLVHLDNMNLELLQIKNQISDWQTVVFAVAYHDIIYNPQEGFNEERSGEFCKNRLSQLAVPGSKIEKCFTQILATKAHNLSEDADTNFLIDADLAILGANTNAYRDYTTMIRKEYKHLSEAVYTQGRSRVLQSFLEMPHIFKTKHFRDQYETQAIENMHRELKTLLH